MKVAFVVRHDATSARKTGLHFWSQILLDSGASVNWISIGVSRLSLLKDSKPLHPGPYNEWQSVVPGLKKYVWCPLFHPTFNYFPINIVLCQICALYPHQLRRQVIDDMQDADLILFDESGLPLVPKLARACPKARLVYYVADRLTTLNAHPLIIKAEKKALPYFHLIRVPASAMIRDFPRNLPVRFIPQGLEKQDFDLHRPNPYARPRNAISVGDMLFHAAPLEALAEAFTDWTFHIFGRYARLNREYPNVVTYGETPFEKIIPYMQHANIGLAPYKATQDADYLSQSSLKLIQYTYCRLPIVAPDFVATGRDHVLPYDAYGQPSSIISAFEKAQGFDRSTIDHSSIVTWVESLKDMLEVCQIKWLLVA